MNDQIIINTPNREPNSFCEVAGQKCYLNYCDENGCQDRKRRYTALGVSLLNNADLMKHLLENAGNEEQTELATAEITERMSHAALTSSATHGLVAVLTDVINEHIGHGYWCGRDWSAWEVGTMHQADFSRIDEADTAAELAESILAALTSPAPAATPAPADAASAGQWLPVRENGGPQDAMLEEEYLYVELPDGTVTQAMYTECNYQPEHTEIGESHAWGHHTEVDHMDPLPVQPVRYFTPPAPTPTPAPATAAPGAAGEVLETWFPEYLTPQRWNEIENTLAISDADIGSEVGADDVRSLMREVVGLKDRVRRDNEVSYGRERFSKGKIEQLEDEIYRLGQRLCTPGETKAASAAPKAGPVGGEPEGDGGEWALRRLYDYTSEAGHYEARAHIIAATEALGFFISDVD